MLQAIFEKIWINEEGEVSSDFSKIYKNIAGPIKNDLAKRNEKSAPDASDADFSDLLLKSYSKFFGYGLNNNLLVVTVGLEPTTPSM